MRQWKATVHIYVQADTEEDTYPAMEKIIRYAETTAGVDLVVYETGDFRDEADNDPQCVCGVYRSEHALCGCGEWERAR